MTQRRAAGPRRGPGPLWWVGLAAGIAACVVDAMLPVGEPQEVTVYFVTAGIALAAVTVAAARMRGPARAVWWSLLVAAVLLVVGDAVYDVQQFALGQEPFPGWAEPLYFASYAAQLVALALLVRRRTTSRDREAWLDATIISLAAIAVVGSFVIVPMIAGTEEPLLTTVCAVAYPLLDVLVLSGLVRVLVGGGRWHTSLGLVVLAMLFMLTADLAYNVIALNGDAVDSPSWIEALFLAYVVLVAAAATAPGASTVADPVPERPGVLTRGRLVGLAVGALTAPVALAVRTWSEVDAGARLLAVASIAVILLVLWRVVLLFQTVARQSRQLADMARLDPLTGLPNRRTWDVALERADTEARGRGTSVCIAMLDLDRFKAFNDVHGHPSGDALLVECATAWRAALGDDGLLARYGGEEFSVLLTGATVRRAEEVLERLRRATPPAITVSVGIAPWDGVASFADTVDRADRALYAAKSLGRDRVVVHEGDRAVPVDRSDRVAPLSRHVVGVFQPVVELATGTVRSYDARARLPRLRASESSQAAKRAGFGPAVEAAALALALDGHREGVPVQVSLSAEGLRDADLLARLPADLSTVRIVVRAADLDDRSGVMGLLPALRERGATLMYLHDVPVPPNLAGVAMLGIDAVAVDAGLVRAPDSWGQPDVLTDLVAWAGERRLPLLAEDVRTEAERDVLRRLGVTAGSGRLFDGIAGRPAREAATGAGLGLTAALGAPV